MNDAAEPTSKVVRLPRDWLGPHEELVPFGSRARAPEGEPGGSEPSGSPPTAEDFWGERSAAIHGVVQAPASGGPGAAPRFALGRRHLAAACVLAVAAATGVVVLSGGAAHQLSGGARLNLATIFDSGISRGFTIATPRIISAKPPSPPHAGRVRQMAHRVTLTRATSHPTQRESSPAPPAPTYAARATPATPAPTYRTNGSVSTSRGAGSSAHPASSAGAAVSPTGESGVLGPVQSPNG